MTALVLLTIVAFFFAWKVFQLIVQAVWWMVSVFAALIAVSLRVLLR
jgi:hypothetical protein